jgi:type IV secretion system protein VirB6
VFLLVIPQLRDKFFSWLNTALYFVFYYVLCNLYMTLFFKFVTDYMNGIVSAAAAGSAGKYEGWADHGFEVVYNLFGGGNEDKSMNLLGQFLPLVAMAFIMAFMFLQLSTIAGSMTSGAGGAIGQGASSLLYYIRGITRSALGKSGG